jgi:hypothetical protein
MMNAFIVRHWSDYQSMTVCLMTYTLGDLRAAEVAETACWLWNCFVEWNMFVISAERAASQPSITALSSASKQSKSHQVN